MHYVDVGGVQLALVDSGSERRVPLGALAASLALRRATRYKLEAKMRAAWRIAPWRLRFPDGRIAVEQCLPVEWLDGYLWRLRDPVKEGRRAALSALRAGWREAIRYKIPELERLALAAQAELCAARGRIEALEAELAARRGRADRRRARGLARGTLGPLAFQEMRAAAAEDVPAMAARFGCSPDAVRQVRAGSYRSALFREWVQATGAQSPGATRANPAEHRARDSWGAQPPEWVLALARACDAGSQRTVARQLGISPAAVSLALGARYPARLDSLERKVRAEFMA